MSADALWLARHARERRPLLVLAASAADAERLREETAWFDPRLRVHRLPDWEILPYEEFSPHPDLISERLATLWQMQGGSFDVVIVPVATALQRLPPRSYLAGRTFHLRQKDRLDLAALRGQLVLAGYAHVQQVMSPGEFCVRGGLVDLFPSGSAVPYRIDLVGEEIESIKTFDVDTQRSIYPVGEVRLLPAREFPLDEEGRARFRENFRERFEGDPSRSRAYKDVSSGLAPAGVECYLPLFFSGTETIFDYVPKDTRFVIHGELAGSAESFWKDLKSRYELLRGDRDRPLLEPRDLYLPVEDLFIALKEFERKDYSPEISGARALPRLEVDRRSVEPLKRLREFLSKYSGRVLISAEGAGRRETLMQLLAEHDVHPVLIESWDAFLAATHPLAIAFGPVTSGFERTDQPIAIVTEAELYPGQVRQARRRDARAKSSAEGMLRDLVEVKEGDPVVHSQHGIARYRGLVTMDLGEGPTEFLYLEYEGGDKLYVPVSQLHVISRYTGASPDSAPLHRLGSGAWEKARRKAAQQVRDTAAELLDLYAKRTARKGFQFPLAGKDFEAFNAGFEFEETPDQAAAIEAVVLDMTSGKPMDRLVCGDVGFGKTEVAMRAAFVAVAAGKQVAILVPTTLLAEQHFENFSDRFANFPVKIAEFSRFRSAKEIAAGVEGLASGGVDIAIGTHKLIQKDVKFKDLGLVIIDEEHRFGVRQKEQLKQLRSEVDVLTLTATPIPRTLALSLEGLRDFSVIATAPQRRLAIKTIVNRETAGIVREAVMRELKRGGQAYYLHNEVETIENRREELEKLLPEARIAVAHGQMRERDLEGVMRDFYHQRANVLLCSTIIETGIDVPTSNTIIIHRADRFGLAQLHQLRGRVGRSHHQAYAYLLTPPEEALSANAKKRLEAIQMMEELGAGFYLAMHDLEIRGAGEVLGESQSGGIHDVGFALYTEMLESAVRSLKAGKEPDLSKPFAVATEVNLHAPALLPTTYCGDVNERLVIYKRLANGSTAEDIERLTEELVDRFGPLPDPTRVLLECHRLRIQGAPLGVAKIDASPAAIVVQFVPQPPIDARKVLALVQSSRLYTLPGPDRVRIAPSHEDLKARANEVRRFLGRLA
ncbi:transcription-repair coupling factor [Usitatibacter palustris]|uniref:Transcription-repair-coupling factor n=1 Tax=Usitatibacter palustris TaxID=2732487 RepID=A0A6M4H4F4_9PROT|nr:transcription-repair coupling factor [Usitatibacter palustris]QJR14416.1 Transcription-repair-coupling factor [Usitatibacter palustris]